jgi:hypothetical protein
MMDKRLEFQVAFPFWMAYAANLQIIRWSVTHMIVSAVFPLAGLFLIYTMIAHRHTASAIDVLTVLGCLFFTPLITALTLFLLRRKNPASQGPFTYAFDADGVHASNATISLTIKWAAIHKVRESGSFLFFFVASGRAHSMPLTQLRSAGVLQDLRELSRRMVRDVRLRD